MLALNIWERGSPTGTSFGKQLKYISFISTKPAAIPWLFMQFPGGGRGGKALLSHTA
jgi:hypothetical protein